MQGGSITWNLDVNEGPFDRKLAGADAKAAAFGASLNAVGQSAGRSLIQNVGSAFDNISNSLGGFIKTLSVATVTGSIGLGTFVKFGLQSAASIQTAQQSMEVLSGSAEDARKIVGQLYNFVLGKPLTFPDAAQAAKTLLGYGVSVKDVVPSMKDLGSIAIVTGGHLDKLSLAYGQVNARGKLMGQEVLQLVDQGVPIVKILADHFHKSLTQMAEDMQGGNVSAQEFNAAIHEYVGKLDISKFGNTLENRIISLKGSLRSLAFAMLGVKIDPIQGMVVEAGGLFDIFSRSVEQASKSMKSMKPAFAEVGKSVGNFITQYLPLLIQGIVQLAIHLPDIAAALVALGAAWAFAKIGSWATALVGLVAQVGFFTGAIDGATASMLGFDVAAGANPIGLIVAAITALVAGLVFLQVRFGLITKAFELLHAAAQPVINVFKGIGEAIRIIATGDFRGSKSLFGLQEDSPVVVALLTVHKILGQIYNLVASNLTSAWKTFSSTVAEIQKQLSPLAGVFNALKPILKDIGIYLLIAFGAAVFGPIIVAIGLVIAAIVAVSYVIKAAASAFSYFISSVEATVSAVQAAANWVGNAFKTAFDAVASAARTVGGVLASVFGAIMSVVLPPIQAVMFVINALATIFFTVFNAIVTIVYTILSTLAQIIFVILLGVSLWIWNNFLSPVLNFFVAGFTAVYNFVAGIVRAVWNVIVSVFTAIYNTVAPIVSAVWNVISSTFNRIWSTVSGIVSSVYNTVASGFSRLGGAANNGVAGAYNAVAGFVGRFVGAGRDLINGLVAGVANNAGAVVSKVQEICRGALDAVKRFFGIKSPSTVMKKQGSFIMQGLAQGIAAGASSAALAASNASSLVADRFANLSATGTVSVSSDTASGIVSNANTSSGGGSGAKIVQNIYPQNELDMDVVNRNLAWETR